MTDRPGLFALHGVIRPYAWGSRTAIPELLGTVPTGEPAAELWLGAHPDDPSFVPAHDDTLDRLVAADPLAMLGAANVERFGPQLPFLLKVLAADTALSIQVHPDLAQAKAGFAAEDARGVARDSPQRNYKDANHKPELLCALSPFDALCGFRPVAQTVRLLDALGVEALAPYREMLAGPDGLRAAFTTLLDLDDPGPLIDEVVAGAKRLAATSDWAAEAGWVVRLAGQYPGDIGAVLALLLNLVHLQPGEAIFLAAGNVHAYLHGTGVEVLANSDNVLRCGLTPKHVDVRELLRVTDFRSLDQPRWPARDADEAGGGWQTFEVPVPDFELSVIDLDGRADLAAGGPQIVLCVEGTARLSSRGESVPVPRGRAAFVAAEASATVTGSGRLFRASPAGTAIPGT